MLVLTLLASILCTTPDAASAEVRVPKELQLEQPWQTGWACGPNSLYFLLALNGNVKDFEGFRSAVPIREGGNSMEELRLTAAQYGLKLTSYKTTRLGLAQFRPPFIAHLRAPPADGGHFLVVVRMSAKSYDVIDGSHGTLLPLSPEIFHQYWSGHILALTGPSGAFLEFLRLSGLAAIPFCFLGAFFTLRKRHVTKRHKRLPAKNG